jgi:hypothetical protein
MQATVWPPALGASRKNRAETPPKGGGRKAKGNEYPNREISKIFDICGFPSYRGAGWVQV